MNLGTTSYSDKPEATLLNLKSQGGLIYPNDFVFGLVTAIEKSFVKYCEKKDVFLMTIDDFFDNNKFINFPCVEHKKNVLTFIISNYIIMRMRQYSLMCNKNQIKLNAKNKKFAKLVKT